jgi:hypothetical protein
MSIDDLLHGLHRDRTLTIEEQLRSIEREIATRRLVSAEHTARLFEQIADLNVEINRLLPEHENAIDPHKVIRQGLERERRTLEREITAELRNRWRDLADLKREERQLQREHHEESQRYERHTGHYDG